MSRNYAMLAVLSDGQWHRVAQVLFVGFQLIPPERAVRAWKRANRPKQVNLPPSEDLGLIARKGRRTLAKKSFTHLIRSECVEIKRRSDDSREIVRITPRGKQVLDASTGNRLKMPPLNASADSPVTA